MNITIETLCANHPALTPCAPDIKAAQRLLADTFKAGGKLLLCGNGGSCADCDHITGELLKGFLSHRPLSEEDCFSLADALPEGEADPDLYLLAGQLQGGLPAISLPSMTALGTAFSNDVEPALTFAQGVWALGRAGDTLLCLSTSGSSRNVILAAKAARAKGLHVVSLTGETESSLSAVSDVTVRVPATETYRVQEYHLPVYHYLCAAIEEELFGSPEA